MGLIDSIASSSILYLDTNILIRAFNNEQASLKLLERINEINPKVIISTLVIEEFLVKVYKEKLEKDIEKYEDFITGGNSFIVIDFNRQIARKTAQLRAKFNLRSPDAIHLATAICAGAKTFITADKRIPKKIEGLQIVII